MPFCYAEAAANLLTNPALDPFGKIPEIQVLRGQGREGRAAGRGGVGGKRPRSILSQSCRNGGLLRGLSLRDGGIQSRDVFQQALAGEHQKVISELRILKVDLEQFFRR